MELSDKEKDNSTHKVDNQETQFTFDREGEKQVDKNIHKNSKDICIPEINLIQFKGSLEDMYNDMRYQTIFANLPLKLIRCHKDAFTMKQLKVAIRVGLNSAKQYVIHRKREAYSAHNSEDDSSIDSDETDDGSPYCKQKGPRIPEVVDEIENSYDSIIQFFIHLASIPTHDMGLRAAKMNLPSKDVKCFCPFGKMMKCFGKDGLHTGNWYKESQTCQFLIDKDCKANQFKSFEAMLQHCKSAKSEGDWWHAMYYDYVNELYEIDALIKKERDAKKKKYARSCRRYVY